MALRQCQEKELQMNLITTLSRLFLGLAFVVFGLNGFLQFIPMPPLPEAAGAYMGAMAATGYFFPLLKITEIVAGLLLLFNRFTALALVVLAPIVVQILFFHAFLTPGALNLIFPILLVVAGAITAMSERQKLAPLLRP
jgi:putative oxidoreductase